MKFKLNLSEALHKLYQKFNYSPLQVVAFIPKQARKTFHPCALPFVPQAMREALDPSATDFVPQSVRIANELAEAVPRTVQSNPTSLYPKSPAATLVARGMLNVQAEEFAPESTRDTAQPHAAVPVSRSTLNPQVPEFVPVALSSLNVHAAIFISTNLDTYARITDDITTSSSSPASDTQSTAITKACDLDVHAEVFVPKHRAGLGEQTASHHDMIAEPSSRIASLSSVSEGVTDVFDISLREIEDTDDCFLDSLLGDAFHSQFREMQLAKDQLELTEQKFRSLQDTVELSLVRYVDPVSLARASLLLPRGPACDMKMHIIACDEPRTSFTALTAAIPDEKLALHRVTILPVFPLLLAILACYAQQIEDFFLGTLAEPTAEDTVTAEASLISDNNMYSESNDGEAAYSFAKETRHSKPWQSGFGPSFRDYIAEKEQEYQLEVSSQIRSAHTPLIMPVFHHRNYFGQKVYHASDTDPALSLALILGTPKGSMSRTNNRYHARLYAIIRSAFLFVDPVIYHGDVDILSGLSMSQVRVAAIGNVWKFYRPYGTCIQEPRDQSDPVCWDDGRSSGMPLVFTEVNDLGAGKFTQSGEPFGYEIESAYASESAQEQARLNALKDPAFVQFSRRRSWSPPGPSPLFQVQLVDELPAPKLVSLDRMLEPSKKSWADLDDEDSLEIWNQDLDQVTESLKGMSFEDQISENGGNSEASSLQTQILETSNENFLEGPDDDSSSVYSSQDEDICVPTSDLLETNGEEAGRSARASQMDLLRQQGASNPCGDDSFSFEDFEADTSEHEQDFIAADEEMSPIPLRYTRRSLSNALPETKEVLKRSMSSRAASAPSNLFSGFTSELAYRSKGSLSRSSTSWDLRDIARNPLPTRPEAPLSPIMLASIAEDAEDPGSLADLEDNDEEDALSLSQINQAYRESNGLPEPGLRPIREEFGADSMDFTYRTPTTLTRYRRRQSDVKVLPTILSDSEVVDEDQSIIAGISYTPPPPSGTLEDEVEEDSVSQTSSIDSNAIFGSSPPYTPTKAEAEPLIEFKTQPQGAGGSLLDGISTSPLSAVASPVDQSAIGFSGVMTLAVTETEDSILVVDAVEDTQEETASLREGFALFLAPTILQEPEMPAPTIDTASAHGQNSIAELPDVKKAWRLSKLKSIMSKPKEDRAVLKKKRGRKVSGSTMISQTSNESAAKNGSKCEQGFWGSVKSTMSSTIRRR